MTPPPPPAEREPAMGRGRGTVFTVLAILLVVVAVELGARGLTAFRAGPHALLYGFVPDSRARRTLALHDDIREGYSRYPPNAVLKDFDAETGAAFDVHVNAHGFRGPDFAPEKARGTIRVVTLGASSTFGYHARDDETWPVRLQEDLDAGCPDAEYEVINLGMPHLLSEEILALFRAEALPLHPDVVTFYEGVNDASMRRERHHLRKTLRRSTVLRDTYRMARDHLLLVRIADDLVRPHAERWNAAAVDAHAATRVGPFLAHLSAIREECVQHGILFVVITQQATSLEFPRSQLRGLTYEAEEAALRARLADGGTVPTPALSFLTHARLMAAERVWAAEHEGSPLVDVIAATDERRDALVSWVHLTPEGNELVARAVSRGLLEWTCPSTLRGIERLRSSASGTDPR